MAAISIPYGNGIQNLTVDDVRLRVVLAPSHLETAMTDQSAIVRDALHNPIASPRLCEMARGKRNILVITSDHTRPMPSRITLPLFLEEIRHMNPDADVRILIATGMHRMTTAAELRIKFGDTIVDRETIVVHDAEQDGDMLSFGVLPSGGRLRLNKLVKWADLVVSEGFIEPHFFAGFSGGRKSILPGVAARETVLYNHNAQFLKSRYARQGNLEGNPIHRDMLFAAKAAELRFILNVLIDADKRVIAAVAGEPEEAHARGCALSMDLAQVDAVAADIVVTSNGGYPLDQNVYQSVKGINAAEACVRQGGIIILCAALGDGHGGEAFYRWFADRKGAVQVARDIDNVLAKDTKMDQWEAQLLARALLKADCYFVTGEENRALIEAMHMIWMPDVNTALQEATRKLGETSTVTVIPDGVGVIVREVSQ
jgi:nickel-dependent lactate racemase